MARKGTDLGFVQWLRTGCALVCRGCRAALETPPKVQETPLKPPKRTAATAARGIVAPALPMDLQAVQSISPPNTPETQTLGLTHPRARAREARRLIGSLPWGPVPAPEPARHSLFLASLTEGTPTTTPPRTAALGPQGRVGPVRQKCRAIGRQWLDVARRRTTSTDLRCGIIVLVGVGGPSTATITARLLDRFATGDPRQ